MKCLVSQHDEAAEWMALGSTPVVEGPLHHRWRCGGAEGYARRPMLLIVGLLVGLVLVSEVRKAGGDIIRLTLAVPTQLDRGSNDDNECGYDAGADLQPTG